MRWDHWALGQLILARLREFYREPEAIFWVYGFPILIVVALGIAFRNKPVERITVDVQQKAGAESDVTFAEKSLNADPRYVVSVHDEATCQQRLRTGKTDLDVIPVPPERDYVYLFDPARPDG